MQDIVPTVLYQLNESGKLINEPVNIIGTAFFNSDIYAGDIYKNDLYVTVPYTDEYFYDYPSVSGADLKAIFCTMVSSTGYPGCPEAESLPTRLRSPEGFPKYFISLDLDQIVDDKLYSLVISDYDSTRFEEKSEKIGITVTRDEGLYTGMSPFEVYEAFVE